MGGHERESRHRAGPISELDEPEAKRAYIDDQVELAVGLRRELEGVVERAGEGAGPGWQESEGVQDLIGDLDHWEDEVRADLKEAFSLETARLFSSDAVEPRSPDGDGDVLLSRANALAYVDRRIARLREIRAAI